MTEDHKDSPEFRAMAIKLAIASDNVSRTARELGITPQVLYNWLRVYEKQKARGDSRALNKQQEAEIKAKDKRIAELEMENEILKKAAAYFAKGLE